MNLKKGRGCRCPIVQIRNFEHYGLGLTPCHIQLVICIAFWSCPFPEMACHKGLFGRRPRLNLSRELTLYSHASSMTTMLLFVTTSFQGAHLSSSRLPRHYVCMTAAKNWLGGLCHFYLRRFSVPVELLFVFF